VPMVSARPTANQIDSGDTVYIGEQGLRYAGIKDTDYPKRLAECVRHLYENSGMFKRGRGCVDIARKHFDYRKISKNFIDFMTQIIQGEKI